MRLTVRNWAQFQHYKDRSPPWIRLHRGLLDNKDFQRLPVESRALAPMLWLLASESVDGVIDATYDDLAFRLRTDERSIEQAIRPLVQRGFFVLEQDDSDVLAECERVATPETETEAETEADSETEALSEADASQSFGKAARAAKPRRKAESGPTWDAYETAYESRYGEKPLRNATTNSQMAQFIGRVPLDEAPAIATFYVGHQGAWYVQSMHSVAAMLRDSEKLRTEWATKRQVTRTQAQQADRTQSTLNVFGPLIAEAKAKEEQDAKLRAA